LGRLYEPVSDDEAIATVRRASDQGVCMFDTAPLYGFGESERRLGLALRELAREQITISTKIGRILQAGDGRIEPTFGYSPTAIRRSLAGSLERLGVDRVDVVHVHDPDLHMEEVLRTTLPALRAMQADETIGAVGAGMNHSAPLTRFVESGLVDCVLIAGRWTLLDQSALDDLLPAALANGVSVIAAGVFNSGVLADPDGPLGHYFYGPTPPDVLARVRRIQEICRHHDVSLQSAALQFPLLHPAVTTVCIGCRSVMEVESNGADLAAGIPAELWSALVREGLVAAGAVDF
jgi:D-threo-aldose 1-dehydrogenase